MVPYSAVSGVCDYDNDIVPDEAVAYLINDCRGMIVAARYIRIARMLIVQADGLVEADGGKGPVPDRPYHIALILQVFASTGRAIRVVGEIREGLMMKYESGIRMTSGGCGISIRIP